MTPDTSTRTPTGIRGVTTTRIKWLVATVVFVSLPFLFSELLVGQVLIFAIFAMGYNLLLGYGGEPSFGHAAYFGLSAYGTVLFLQYVARSLYVAMVFGIVVAVLASVVFGWLSLRRRGLYFAMITLAFAQMIFYINLQWTDVTGGNNGLIMPNVDGSIGPLDPASGGLEFYVFCLFFLVVCWFGIRRVVNSPFGRSLQAIRENEVRAENLGYNTERYLLIAFVFSGLVSGLAGALYALLFSFVGPELYNFFMSGDIVIMTIIGGVGTLGGPLVGAFVYVLISDLLAEFTSLWPLLLGAFFVAVVIYTPQGLYGVVQELLGEREASFDRQRLLELFGLDELQRED
jgi:branched-chain amino acid transport system permease protein